MPPWTVSLCVPVSLHPAPSHSLCSPHVAELHMSYKYFNRFQHEIFTCKTTPHEPAMMIYGPQNIACIIGNLIGNVFFIPWKDQFQHNKSVVEQKADTRLSVSLRGRGSPCLSSLQAHFRTPALGMEYRVSPRSCDCSNRITKKCISCLPLLSVFCVFGGWREATIDSHWEPHIHSGPGAAAPSLVSPGRRHATCPLLLGLLTPPASLLTPSCPNYIIQNLRQLFLPLKLKLLILLVRRKLN